MKWTIPSDVRDQFSQGVHRDIVIVPHATNVEANPGGPPIITNKRPVFEYVTDDSAYPDGIWKPKYENGQLVRDDVDWVIDNSILIKEKFKYSHTLNSDDNLSFSGCNAAMVQFTIRNKKEYIEELDEHDQPTGNYYWESEIPNLQNYEFVKKASDGTEKEIIGELEGNYVIKVYTYVNGDSSTLMFLGMFRVEEDKVTGNGYERQITAYDFLATFRDMDIFYWYKHLFDGINIAVNDYEEFTQSEKKPDTTDIEKESNYLRPKQEEWTIGDALKDLIYNLSTYDMIVWEDELDDKGKPTGKKICKKGMTINNPSEYGREYKEGALYSGFGMPIMIDEDILTSGTEEYIPDEPGEDEYERYGYMKILEMPFMADPSVLKSESLSMGKFLEDIGRLAGRYPIIRSDKLDENDYIDPTTIIPTTDEPYPNRYNNYERCILTFKPLPSSKNDSKVKTVPDMYLSNHEIAKGFEHETYMVDDIELVTVKLNDKTDITYKKLTKTQRVALSNGGAGLQTYTFGDNLFCSYLVTKSDDEDIKKKLERYSELRTKLFGKENKKGNMTASALFYQGYMNMKYRGYTPYKLTTYADPCRDVGDRILINFEDKVTGEQVQFYSYILERSMEGIQKMMDTYEAKGDISNPIFSNYQTGARYQSGSSFNQQSLGFNPSISGSGGASGSSAVGMSPSDLVQYWRNFGIRLLDEPSGCSALFAKGSESEIDLTKNHMYATSSYPQETYIKDGDTTNKLTIDGQEIDIIEGDYVHVKNYQHDDPAVLDWINNPTDTRQANQEPLYVYTVNGSWNYVGLYDPSSQTYCYYEPRNTFNLSAVDAHFLDEIDNWAHEDEDIYGKTSNKVVTRLATFEEQGSDPEYYYDHYYVRDRDSHYKDYGGVYDGTEHTDPITIEAQYGDVAEFAKYDAEGWYPSSGSLVYAIYQYPGFWTDPYTYPDLTKTIDESTKKSVQLKWSDPPDITDWKPTPATWEGTVIVRKENSPPLHRWDGEKVVRTTTRDKYKTDPYKDEDIEANKVYYYGFFPYYIKISDPEHPIRFYTFTKYIRVETGVITYAPVIESITVDGNAATITYTIISPEGVTYSSIKLYGKIGANPACDDTDDIIIDLDDNETSIVVEDLENDLYFFCIECIDNNDAEVQSNVETADLGFNWDGSEITILWSGDNNKMTAELTEQGGDPFITFRLYINDEQIYQFVSQYVDTSQVSIAKIVSNINIGFLIDEDRELAKPSNIYYVSDQYATNYQKYIYNASDESPSDSVMGDIYDWLQPGI